MNMAFKIGAVVKSEGLKIFVVIIIIGILFTMNLVVYGESIAVSVTRQYLQNAYPNNEIETDDILCTTTTTTYYGLISYISEYETLYFFDNGMFVRCRFTGVFPFVMTSHSENFFHGSS